MADSLAKFNVGGLLPNSVDSDLAGINGRYLLSSPIVIVGLRYGSQLLR